MERTKADFKAFRELCGLSQGDVVQAVGLQGVRAVKSWEDPADSRKPNEAAWRWLEDRYAEHVRAVDTAVEESVRMLGDADGDGFAGFTLSYWRTQEAYDRLRGDGASIGVVNARTRAIAAVLSDMGYEVGFAYPEEIKES